MLSHPNRRARINGATLSQSQLYGLHIKAHQMSDLNIGLPEKVGALIRVLFQGLTHKPVSQLCGSAPGLMDKSIRSEDAKNPEDTIP